MRKEFFKKQFYKKKYAGLWDLRMDSGTRN